MTLQREHMSSVDTAWLRMESPVSHMTIGVVLIFDDQLSLPPLMAVLHDRLLKFDRFRQKVVRHEVRSWWEEDSYFSIYNHVKALTLDNPDSKEDLQDVASTLMNTGLDFRHPLWQIHYIEHFQAGSALIIRIHHCIADGMSLVRLLLSLTDAEADPASVALTSEKPTTGAGSRHHEGMWDVLTHPSHLKKLAKNGVSAIAELARVTLGANDPPSLLKGTISGVKKVAWAEPFALADVKRIGKKLNATVNDVLVAAVAGALRQHFLRNIGESELHGMHVLIPFNLRPIDAPIESLGNQFGMVLLPLPVQVSDPLERLQHAKAAMDQLKHSYQAHVFYGMLEFFGKGPAVVEQTALDILSKKASAVMTNVPGPKKPVYLAGAKLKQPLVWVPQAGNVGVGMAILTYNDIVQFGFVADVKLVPDPNEIAELFIAQFRILEMLSDEQMHIEPASH